MKIGESNKMSIKPKFIVSVIILLILIWVMYNKKNNGNPFVTNEGNNIYTLHEPDTKIGQVKFSFEGPYKKDTGINWKTVTLDFNTVKLEIPLPDSWILHKIDNDKSFISNNNEACRLFTSQAYVIKSPDNFTQLTYNPTCNIPDDNLGMNPEDINVTITFEDTYYGKNAQASRFFDARNKVYRYGPSSGGLGNPRKLFNCLFFAAKDGAGTLFITLKYNGPEDKKQEYLRIVDWIDAHPNIK